MFFKWLFEVERFFECKDITERKKVKFVARKLRGSAWAWWDQLQRMRNRLRKDPIESWEKMKVYLKRQFLPPDYKELLYEKYENFKQLGSVSELGYYPNLAPTLVFSKSSTNSQLHN